MSLSISRSRMTPVLVFAAFMLATLSWTLQGIANVEAQDSGVSGIDLAAIAINPLDLAILGVGPSTIREGRYLDAAAASRLIAWSFRKSADASRKITSDNDFTLAYTLTLDIPGSGSPNAYRVVSSTVYETDSFGAATSFYRALTDRPDSSMSLVPNATTFADESQLVTFTSDEGSGGIMRTIRMAFRSGGLVGVVSIGTKDATIDTRQQIESVANQLIQKMAIVTTGSTPEISFKTIRLQNVDPSIAAYTVSGGQAIRLSGESGPDYQNRQQAYSSVKIGYREQMAIPSVTSGIALTVEISGFDAYDSASSWVYESADRQRIVPGTSDVAVDASASTFGDNSTALTYRTEGGLQVRQLTAQTGQYTFSIDLVGKQLPPATALQQFAQAQLGCLQITSVCNPIIVPADLSPVEPTIGSSPTAASQVSSVATPLPVSPVVMSTSPTVTPAPSPTQAPTPSPRATLPTATSAVILPTLAASSEAATPPVASRFTDTTYPYSISWDPKQWQLVQQGVSNNRSFARFGNGTSDVYLVAGTAYGDDVGACVADAAAGLQREGGVMNVSPAKNRKGTPVAGSTATDAYAVYSYRAADGTPMARYLKCLVLEPGSSTLLFMQIVPESQFNDQIAERNALIAGLKIGPA